ncbi:MAG: hypothetical protein NVV70_16815 [Cellulomonas sp.]|nr:hypothetical protein [Cellulomonas sp.]MCR6649708.1 hypothetical protein [Cellulomonas sp.]
MATFTITPAGVTVNGTPVVCTGVVYDSAHGLTLLGVTVEIAGDDVVHAVSEPDIDVVRQCAADVLSTVSAAELLAMVKPRIRDGRTDPYQAALDSLVEVLRG